MREKDTFFITTSKFLLRLDVLILDRILGSNVLPCVFEISTFPNFSIDIVSKYYYRLVLCYVRISFTIFIFRLFLSLWFRNTILLTPIRDAKVYFLFSFFVTTKNCLMLNLWASAQYVLRMFLKFCQIWT